MDLINFKEVPKISYPVVAKIDNRKWMSYSDFDVTYSVWKRERKSETLVIKTKDVSVAMTVMENLGGKKKFAYIYYTYEGKPYFLCCTLDGKYSRTDFRAAVRILLRPKDRTYYYPQKGLWVK